MAGTICRRSPRAGVWIASALGLLAAVPAAAAPAAGTLTPVEAYRMALARTPVMTEARARIAEAHGAVREAKGNLLPKLGLSFAASGSDNPLNVFGMKLQQRSATFNDFGAGSFLQGIQSGNASAVLFSAPDELNRPGFYTNYQTKLQLTIPIYNGGLIWGGLRRARAMAAAARRGERMAGQKLLFEVIGRYEGLRTADAYVGVAGQAIRAARSYRELSRKLFRHGVVAKTDVLRAQVQLGTARLGLMRAQKQRALAGEGLRILIGRPEGRALRLAPGVVTIDVPREALGRLKADAETANPGLRALDAQVRAARAGVHQARAAYLPHFNLMLAREWNDRTVALSHPSYTVAGVLNWDVLDFGARRGALDRAQARVIRKRAALQQARDGIRLQIEQAWQDARLAAARIQVKAAAVTAAAETARLEKLRYEQGVSIFTQLLSAQAELDQARADRVAARYQETMARAALLLALGRLTPAAVQLTAHQP
ncbi:outer membrane channel protein [bacterium BMS3Bbin12]|nr:outer membrane channel protein [bacterium BMS3Bbin12]GBE51345.1 outer membrane channel protein [bacterium BMS3Bbin13]